MYQARTSGSDRNRIVSAVGAQSTTTTSHSPDATWVLMSVRAKISSRPGRMASSSASTSSTPAQFRTLGEVLLDVGPRLLEAGPGVELLAGEVVGHGRRLVAEPDVERVGQRVGRVGRQDSVRSPASAQRRAVAAATVVLPTPPFPVKTRILMPEP